MRARSEADRRPYLRGRHRHHELLGLEYRRVWRIRLGSSRGRRQDPRRDEAHSRRHPIGKIRQGMDAGKQGQPDLVQSDARQMRRPPDRAGWRQAPRDDAVDQGPRAGGQDQELIDGSVVKTGSWVRALVGSRTARWWTRPRTNPRQRGEDGVAGASPGVIKDRARADNTRACTHKSRWADVCFEG